MGVFKVNTDLSVILNRDAVKLVPELTSISQDELRYVILVVDYVDGPYRKKPLEERKLLAKKQIWKSVKKNPETDKVLIAMEGYKGLVFDIRRETIDVYNKKIQDLQKESLMPDLTFSRLKEIDNQISFLQDRVATITHDLDIEEGEEIELKGQKKRSYLEVWQERQRKYAEYQSNE